jgi:hypothetical protein
MFVRTTAQSSWPRACACGWLATGAKTLYIEPGSQWENGYCKSFNSKLRDEFLNGYIFYSLKELRVLAERWRVHYNTVRPHSSLGYRPPAPSAWLPQASQGHGYPNTRRATLTIALVQNIGLATIIMLASQYGRYGYRRITALAGQVAGVHTAFDGQTGFAGGIIGGETGSSAGIFCVLCATNASKREQCFSAVAIHFRSMNCIGLNQEVCSSRQRTEGHLSSSHAIPNKAKQKLTRPHSTRCNSGLAQ